MLLLEFAQIFAEEAELSHAFILGHDFWEHDSSMEGNLCLIFQFGDDVCKSVPLTTF